MADLGGTSGAARLGRIHQLRIQIMEPAKGPAALRAGWGEE
jgi:hypothetical protein